MATTAAVTIIKRTVIGDVRRVYGVVELTGTYDAPVAISVATLSDNYFRGSDPWVQFMGDLDGYQAAYQSDNSLYVYAPGGQAAHTHSVPAHTPTITVAAGTVEDTLGFDSGGALIANPGGGTITANEVAAGVTGASSATTAAATEADGIDLTGRIFKFIADDIA